MTEYRTDIGAFIWLEPDGEECYIELDFWVLMRLTWGHVMRDMEWGQA